MARNWATGTIGTSPIDVVGAAVGSTSLGVGDGPEPVGGSAVSASVGAGVGGRGRDASARRWRRAGAEAELAAGDRQRDGQCEQAEDDERRTAFHGPDCDQRHGRPDGRAARGQENAPSGRADGA